MTYKTVAIKKNTEELISKCEEVYRKHHPEFDNMHLSNDKLIYEIAKYYLN